MNTHEIARVATARKIMILSTTTEWVHPCWVCANRGHAHAAIGCDEGRCPCHTRGLFAVWP